jgi:YHS domain-containing protein
MQLDPVCGQQVRERGNRQRVEYAGQRYYFCSEKCLQRFDAQPDLFTYGPGEGKLANRDRGVLPGAGAKNPRPASRAKLEAADSDAGPA